MKRRVSRMILSHTGWGKASNFNSKRFDSFYSSMLLPSTSLFSSTLVLGTILAVSRPNWLYTWIGLELNLLSFIPLITKTKSLQETEGAVKYFIVQATGRGLLLLGAFTSTYYQLFSSNFSLRTLILSLRLLLKLGAAPIHWWIPQVISSFPWLLCLILSTWQKVAPLLLLLTSTSLYSSKILLTSSILGALVGGVGGINQSQIRTLLAYSSIGHLAWITRALSIISVRVFSIYFFIYCAITSLIIFLIHHSSQILRSIKASINNLPASTFASLSIILFSLGGLPPLLGFVPKWMVLLNLSSYYLLPLILLLIAGSLLNLFYYLRITFNFLLTPYIKYTSNYLSAPILSPTIIIIGGLISIIIII